MPLLKPVLTPAIILGGVVWTFNNFNVIYLITKGGPMEGTDILVTSLYKAVFEFYRYVLGGCYSTVILIILLIFTWIYLKVTKGMGGGCGRMKRKVRGYTASSGAGRETVPQRNS